MRRSKALIGTLIVVSALGSVVASSASATKLPMTILFLAAESYPVLFLTLPLDELNAEKKETNTTPFMIQNAAGTLTGTGFLLHVEVTAQGLGNFHALILLWRKGATACTGEGETGEGEVLFKGTVKLVHDVSATSGLGILFELAEIKVNCGASKVKFTGTMLGLLSQAAGEVTAINGFLHCSATVGEPAETKYWDEEEVEHTALLLANFGTGFKKACFDMGTAGGTFPLDAHKMVEMMF